MEVQPSNKFSKDGCSRAKADIWSPLTWTWIQSADSDGVRLAVQTQSDGVVSGVAQSLPLLRPVTARHRALQTGYTVTLHTDSCRCSTAISCPEEDWRTCDQGPTLHWVGQGCRLQALRDSGLWSLQCLLWMERVVLSSDGCTQLTVRICVPVFPQVLLQFCHSPVTQLWTQQSRDSLDESEQDRFQVSLSGLHEL